MNEQTGRLLREWVEILAAHSMHAWMGYVRETGLSMPQFGLLMRLYHEGRQGMTHMISRMEVTPAAASQLVDRLVQEGLVARSEDPNDRRARQLALTEAGRRLIEGSFEKRFAWLDEITSRLDNNQITQLESMLPGLIELSRDASTKPACRPQKG